ncbi:MAG: pyridoxal phosphate-dependent aminotransferase [Spirochaetales bacterium]|nr:pyridoxal phosphate-dependent aminotransferase [Spirochaetales bacterium]
MAVAAHIGGMMASSSFIRKMFETGNALKAEHGAGNVFDFSLGNPSAPPPKAFEETLRRLAAEDYPGKYKYMPNAGYPDVREALASWITGEYGVDFPAGRVLMTCGAGGALNAALKTILNPGDRVMVSAPLFMEYRFYAQNHGGDLTVVDSLEGFEFDFGAIEKGITRDTAVFLVNSPNNPSGKVYSMASLERLADILDRKSREFGRRIYLLSDEPYRRIVYDGIKVPSVFQAYPHSLIATSFSKELSIPGERIGWLAVHPQAEDAQALFDGAVLCNRILGYVNAPGLMQKAVASVLDEQVDMTEYQRNRDILCRGLKEIGYDFHAPEGTFYLFPKAPGGDDLKIVDALLQHRVLVVPGRGFGSPGFFRIAFCVDTDTVSRSLSYFKAAFDEVTAS